MKKAILLLTAVAFMAVSCNNNSGNSTETQTESSAAEAAAEEETTGNEITLNAGDDMKYDLNEIRVKEGEQISITLRHTGKLTKDAMGHNFVLLASGVSLADFAAKAIQAKATDYIPEGTNEVIAHTKLIGGGESDTIEFTAPAKGTYEFLCSFPGHSALMKGTFIVE